LGLALAGSGWVTARVTGHGSLTLTWQKQTQQKEASVTMGMTWKGDAGNMKHKPGQTEEVKTEETAR